MADDLNNMKRVIEVDVSSSDEAAEISKKYGNAIIMSDGQSHVLDDSVKENPEYLSRMGDIFKNGIRYTLFKGVKTENIFFGTDKNTGEEIYHIGPKLVNAGNGHRLYLGFDIDSGKLFLSEFMTLSDGDGIHRNTNGFYTSGVYESTDEHNILSSSQKYFYEGNDIHNLIFDNKISSSTNVLCFSMVFNAIGKIYFNGQTIEHVVDFLGSYNCGLPDMKVQYRNNDKDSWKDCNDTTAIQHNDTEYDSNGNIFLRITDNCNAGFQLRFISIYDFKKYEIFTFLKGISIAPQSVEII